MVLAVIRHDEPPVNILRISICHDEDKAPTNLPFIANSKHEYLFFRVRQLDGNIMRFAHPDYYFLPIMRDLMQKQVVHPNTNWGDADDEITIHNALHLVRAKFKNDDNLRPLLLNYEYAINVWENRQRTSGKIIHTEYTEADNISDASEESLTQ